MTNSKIGVVAICAVVAALVGGAFAAQLPPSTTTSIKVFDKPNFKGNELTFDRGVPSLAAVNFNDRPASVQRWSSASQRRSRTMVFRRRYRRAASRGAFRTRA